MKGIAEITVRDKDGKIKLQRREHNTITTAHLEKVKAAIKNQKYARTMPETNAGDFQGIWLHSEQLAHLSDIEPVVLCGGTAARGSDVSQDYSQATKSEVNGNNITSTWVWVLEKDVNIKAISLHSKSFVGTSSENFSRTVAQVLGDKGWRGNYNYSYITFEKFKIARDVSLLKDNIDWITHEVSYCSPLYDDDEYVYSFVNEAGYGGGSKYICVVDNNITTKRIFYFTQFAGLNYDGSASMRYMVMPTAAADWIFIFKSATEIAVYKLPRTESEDTIPLVTTITGTGFDVGTTIIVSNCIIFNYTSQAKTMFCAHSDGTYSLEAGVQIINGVFLNTALGMYLLNRESSPTPVCDLTAVSEFYSTSRASNLTTTPNPAVHNTILNLSAPIAAETGDTLTITYTITVEQEETQPTSAFATDSWATIAAASADGTASTKYKVGDEKTITLTNGEKVTLQIWGFNHDDLADGSGKAGITLGMKNLLASTYSITLPTSGGWEASQIRTITIPEIFATLPNDVKSVIKNVNKLTADDGGSGSHSLVTSSDNLFLFSVKEICGENKYSLDGEGAQYDFWKSEGPHDPSKSVALIKCLSNGEASANEWSTRSPSSSSSTHFVSITPKGAWQWATSNKKGICLGFCV